MMPEKLFLKRLTIVLKFWSSAYFVMLKQSWVLLKLGFFYGFAKSVSVKKALTFQQGLLKKTSTSSV